MFLRAHFPEHVWTSVQVNFNNSVRPHRGLQNLPGSKNLLFCCGDYEGGELWVQGEPLEGFPATRRKSQDGKVIRGQIFPTRGCGVYFDPRALYMQPSRGKGFASASLPFVSVSLALFLKKKDRIFET